MGVGKVTRVSKLPECSKSSFLKFQHQILCKNKSPSPYQEARGNAVLLLHHWVPCFLFCSFNCCWKLLVSPHLLGRKGQRPPLPMGYCLPHISLRIWWYWCLSRSKRREAKIRRHGGKDQECQTNWDVETKWGDSHRQEEAMCLRCSPQ